MKKKFAVVMAVTAGLCFTGGGHLKPAFAGHWDIVYAPYPNADGNPDDPNYQEWRSKAELRYNGTAFRTNPVENVGPSNWLDIGLGLSGFLEAGYLDNFSSGLGNLANGSEGQIKVLFRWFPNQINGQDDPNDPPPSTLNVQVYLHSYIAIRDDGMYNEDVDASTENSTGNITYSYDYEIGSDAYTSDAEEVYPLSIATNGKKDVWTPWLHLSANASGTSTSFNPVVATHGYLDFEILPDYRTIEITSDTEPSNRKENGIQTPNLRDGNGAITVDRAVTYGTYPDLQAPLDIYSSVAEFDLQSDLLGTNPVGFTDPTYDWTFVGGTNLLSHPVTTDEDFPFFLGLRLAGSNSTVPTTSAALTVTDGADGRQFINHYTIRWHDQAEWDLNNYDLIGTNDDKQIWNYFQPDPGSQNRTFCVSGGTGISADYTFENFYNRLIAQSSGDVVEAGTVLLANYVGVEAVPPLALLINKLAGSAGVAATQEVQDYLGGSSTTNQEVSFDSVWDINAVYADDPNDPDDQNVNVIPDFETPKFWAENANGELVQISRPMINGFADDSAATKTHFELCNPQYAKKYEPRKYHGDAYGSHGYIGPTDKGADVKVPGSRLTGEFYPDNWHTDHGQS